MANVLLQGTNFMNFMGHNVWVADGKGGFEGVAVAERDEPPAIIGSHLHKLAYPEDYEAHQKRGLKLPHAHHHPAGGGEEILDVQQRGEYVYAALGEGGFRVYDISNIDNKDFSERIVTAPVSPLGQRLYVKTKFATAVATPTTLGVDPLRKHYPGERGTAHPPDVRVPLRHRPRRRARRRRQQGPEEQEHHRRRDAARRQPVEQLPRARGRRSTRTAS